MKYFTNNLLNYWHLDHYRATHGFKTAIGCLIALGCAELIQLHLHWQMGQWIPITVMVVMSAQIHFGAAVKKAQMRFLGTISGIAIALLTIAYFGDDPSPIIVSCVIFTSCALLTYVASRPDDISYAGTLGGVTVILTLWSQQVTAFYAIQRGIYIILGIIIALLVSRFVFPIHARDVLRSNMVTTLRNLKELYNKTIQNNSTADDPYTTDLTLDKTITKNIAAQHTLIHEACAGSKLFSQKKLYWREMLNSEHRLHRLVNLLYKSLHEIENKPLSKFAYSEEVTEGAERKTKATSQQQLPELQSIHTAITTILEKMASCLESLKTSEAINLEPILNETSHIATILPKPYTTNELIAEHSSIFFIEQILKELETAQQLIKMICSLHY